MRGALNKILLVHAACGMPVAALADNPAARLEMPAVEVIGTTPLPGIGVPIEQVPANVQSATGAQMERRQALDLPEFLERAVDSVNINAAQDNPFQPDVNFRGFTASPLLGTPQGLSVFVDGVRVNEAFGDIVNWDLIPRAAISSINLIPGSNPVFGLNTLGGALGIQTKSGFQFPGYAARVTGGAFGRRAFEAEYGGHGERVDYFVAGNRHAETGWREHAPSDVRQLFAKTGFQDDETDIDVSLTAADNTLHGGQSLPLSMLDNRRQAYTWPDRIQNELAFLNAKASHFLRGQVLLSANLYYRSFRSEGFFSNVNDRFDPSVPVGPGNSTGFNNLNNTDQHGYGGGAQLTFLGNIADRANQLNVGFGFDGADTDFLMQQQEATFTAARDTVAVGPYSVLTSVQTRNRYYGLYIADTLSLTPALHLTLSGRYNRARVAVEDRTGNTPALNGGHYFNRFDPAVGLNFIPVAGVTLFATHNRGMRAPTPAELTCADANAPCRLPNAFLADPPLKPVSASTWEAGVRSSSGGASKWRAAIYRTDLDDDIQFVNAARVANAGFFQNVGRTRRQGIELGGEYHAASAAFYVSYAWIDATYRSPFAIPSVNNSAAVDTNGDGIPDTIQVTAGRRIPGIPRQLLKIRAERGWNDGAMFGVDLIASFSQFARGDENNQDVHGAVPGYAVLHADARYALGSGWHLLAKIQNLLDRRYEAFGVLGTNFFRGPGNTFDANSAVAEQFRSSGAPRAAWVGIEYRFDPRKKR